MPAFDLSLDELQKLTERELRALQNALEQECPAAGTPLFDLYQLVSDLADAAWAANFAGRTEELTRASADLSGQAALADAELKQLSAGAALLNRLAKAVGYLDQAAQLAAHVAPLLAMARPGLSSPAAPSGQAYYGWQPDKPDHRDLLYAAIRPAKKKLPARVDLRRGCSPVENQLQLGSCTANALVGALEFLQIKLRRPRTNLSRLFLYYNERAAEGTVNEDSGAALRDGVKCLRKLGICSEDLWPYDVSKFKQRPPRDCFRKALDHQIVSYHAIKTLEESRACLAEGYPFVFGFTVYAGFESERVAKSGVLNYPAKNEQTVGGHAVLAVGYDDKTSRFWVRNSWGWDWGQAGYFTMPYAYAFGDRNHTALGTDFWTIRTME